MRRAGARVGRTDASLLLIEEMLGAMGYAVHSVDYPSTEGSIAGFLRYLDDAVAACGDATVNFVTHSLGGLIVRGWLATNRPEAMGRVVMLGPPNQGSEIVDRLGDLVVYRLLTGPAGLELGTGADGVPARLGQVDFELGVIAGNRSFNPFFSRLIPGADDGKVSVASTRAEGMADHIVLPVTHTFLMNNPMVIAQVAIFLRDGAFEHGLTYGEIMRRLTARG